MKAYGKLVIFFISIHLTGCGVNEVENKLGEDSSYSAAREGQGDAIQKLIDLVIPERERLIASRDEVIKLREALAKIDKNSSGTVVKKESNKILIEARVVFDVLMPKLDLFSTDESKKLAIIEQRLSKASEAISDLSDNSSFTDKLVALSRLNEVLSPTAYFLDTATQRWARDIEKLKEIKILMEGSRPQAEVKLALRELIDVLSADEYAGSKAAECVKKALIDISKSVK